MKSRIYLCIALALAFVACNNDGIERRSKVVSGNIVGFIGCYDERAERTPENLRAGVVVLTNTGDSLLTFSMKGNGLSENPLYGKYGTFSVSSIAIPYDFQYVVIEPTDKRYVQIGAIIEDAMHLPCPIPNMQVEIIPVN